MSDQTPSPVFDTGAAPGPSAGSATPTEPGWSSLREIGTWDWLRLVPGVVRSVLSGGPSSRPGGVPALRQSQDAAAADVAELDFGDSAPTTDPELPAAETATELAEGAAGQDPPGIDAEAAELEALREAVESGEVSVAEAVAIVPAWAELAHEAGLDLDDAAAAEEIAATVEAEAAEAVADTDAAQAVAAQAAEAVAEADEAGLS